MHPLAVSSVIYHIEPHESRTYLLIQVWVFINVPPLQLANLKEKKRIIGIYFLWHKILEITL